MVLAALLVQIRLEVIIDNLAARLREAALVPVVAVAEVVALAARQEVEAQRLVGRVGAAVRGPDQIVGGLVRPGRLEFLHRCMQEEIVGGSQAAAVARAAEKLGNRDRKGRSGWKEGEEGKEEEEESLHCAFLM